MIVFLARLSLDRRLAVRVEAGYMEPTEVNTNRSAQLRGGRMSLDDTE